MKRIQALALLAAVGISASPVAADILPVATDLLPDAQGPFAVSIAATLDTASESPMALTALSASVATGGSSAASNATAVVDGTLNGATSNAGVSTNNGVQSNVTFSGETNEFVSDVSTGTQYMGCSIHYLNCF
ncbi:hypothetical protein O4G76_08385 [Limimaricola sp. G21655-S1]|uniref:hypothetical protein n=1 Tax=Limimaricola sp. G21655-S1 TaxID=3014768 RepID=UPI0022AF12E4|nr:hypothetical protein [Limimaricola sp. G21655-S1]MCZ4260858.1 hypothetical protein [Limimaricola sp. G21655-S1]